MLSILFWSIVPVVCIVALLALLVQKELLSGFDGPRAVRVRRAINIALVPLLAVFAVNAVVRFNVARQQQAAALRGDAASPRVIALGSAIPTPAITATAAPSPSAAPFSSAAAGSAPAASATAAVSPTPVPSPTGSATPQASATVVTERLNIALDTWPTRTTDTASLAYNNGEYRVALNGQPAAGVSLLLPAQDYRFGIDVAIQDGTAGIVFLAQEPTTFYRMMFDGAGAFAIQQLQSNTDQAVMVQDWTPNAALQVDGPVRIRVERRGESIQFFAGNQLLTTLAVPPGQLANQVGVVVADQAGRGEATFANLVVEQLRTP